MSEFVTYLEEVFSEFGAVNYRPMFGGFGLYHEGLMFALVADDVLYLKADTLSKRAYQARDLLAFEYLKQGKTVQFSYFLAPEEIYEDSERAKFWANLAFEAALRAKRPQKKN